MAGRFRPVPNLKEMVEGLPKVVDHVDAAANRIARATVLGSPMARSYPGRYGPVTVTPVEVRKRRVAAQGPFAHLDEWGSANNPPHASMRRAAEREGRFKPEGR